LSNNSTGACFHHNQLGLVSAERSTACGENLPRGGFGTSSASSISSPNSVKGLAHVPAERGEERVKESPNAEVRTPNCQTVAVQELRAELFFLVVAGLEDLATGVEAVNQTFDGVGCRRAHAARGYASAGASQAGVGKFPSPLALSPKGEGCRKRALYGVGAEVSNTSVRIRASTSGSRPRFAHLSSSTWAPRAELSPEMPCWRESL